MRMLTVEVLATPEDLASACRTQSRRTSTFHACCPFPATTCPIKMDDICYLVQKEHWEKALRRKADGN